MAVRSRIAWHSRLVVSNALNFRPQFRWLPAGTGLLAAQHQFGITFSGACALRFFGQLPRNS